MLTLEGRPLLMGILNVTPDSFSDGGLYLDRDRAVTQGLRMVEEGADIIDVGGESTRPGAEPVHADEESGRVVPVIEELGRRTGVVLSVDTMKAVVARRAIGSGAHIINDVSALTHDPHMAEVAAESGSGVVLMHMQGTPRTMQKDPRYEDVVAEVRAFLADRLDRLAAAGIARDAMAVDPGIGFGKTVEHNVRLLSHLEALGETGRPVVVGLSRKSFLGRLTGRETGERLAGSLAALAFCVMNGAHVMRVHDVKESFDALRVAAALSAGKCASTE
jgi:dihydropteroate synthase